MASRLLFQRSGTKKTRFLSPQAWMSILGLILGVASLVVAMAVISGFQATLRQSVVDVTGHVQIFKLDSTPETWTDFFSRVKKMDSRVTEASRFIMIEGVLAHKGKLAGILVEGVDANTVTKVLDLRTRVLEGTLNLNSEGGSAKVLIGKGIAQNFSLKVGDEFRMVVPVAGELDVSQFHRRVGVFQVAGILDLGKYDYDQRWIFAGLEATQAWADVGNRYSGLILKTDDVMKAREVEINLAHELGSGYRLRDWREVNENLLEAIEIEKVVIFFVIFIIVVAAAFNVAGSLYINVVRATPAIAIFKTLGMTKKQLAQIFSWQGLLLGLVGTILGFALGLLFCAGFIFLQDQFGLIQGSVYKIDHINLQIRFWDWLTILSSTLLICFVATWAPARRAASLMAIEGLRQE